MTAVAASESRWVDKPKILDTVKGAYCRVWS